MKWFSRSEEETRKLAARWVQGLAMGQCIALCGELGAGKTIFVKGFVAGVGGAAYDSVTCDNVTSPTFTLENIYPGPPGIRHWDLYRIQSLAELDDIGFRESCLDPNSYTLVEWADRFPELQSFFGTTVQLDWIDATTRAITITGEKS